MSTPLTLQTAFSRKQARAEMDYRGSSIPWSKDLQRVFRLPRRTLGDGVAEAQKWTDILRKDDAPCDCVARWGFCIKKLNPIQGLALEEFHQAGGLFGMITVGGGKTGIDILLPMLLAPQGAGEAHAVLLIPSSLRAQLEKRDIPQWSAHFHTPNIAGGTFEPGKPVLSIVTYAQLSRPSSSALLSSIRPDLVIADEMHSLKDRSSARTKRFLRAYAERPNTKFVGLSGTVIKKSIKDGAHLSQLALHDGSPFPLDYPALESWAAAIDPVPYPRPPGMLEGLITGNETLSDAYGRRVRETPGVVATSGSSVDCSLYLVERLLGVPKTLGDALQDSFRNWRRPDGEELVEATELTAVQRQLACGFYYRRTFPHGEPDKLILSWLDRRASWHKELRHKLKRGGVDMDSPLLLRKAAERYLAGERGPKTWKSECLAPWMEVEDLVQPAQEVVWLSDFLIEDVASWASENTGVIWVDFVAFGQRLYKTLKVPYYPGGAEAATRILSERGERSIIASMSAHGTGRDGLQFYFDKCLLTSPAEDYEQLLGRLHREGQKADEVTADLYLHTPELKHAFSQARKTAFFDQQFHGPQKLCYATVSLDAKDSDLYTLDPEAL